MDLWQRLKTAEKPIVLYGMGNGADKVLAELERLGIKASAVFASEGFVRQKLYKGFAVRSYAETKALYPDMIVLVCFGTRLPEVIDGIREIGREQELYAPDVSVIGGGIFDLGYARAHRNELEEVYSRLADEHSRRVFECVVRYRISGGIDFLVDCESEPEEAYKEILRLGNEEVYIDLGAYNGDTIGEFLKYTGGYREIYAVEPDAKSFKKLRDNTSGLRNIYYVNKGVSDKATAMPFKMSAGRNSAVVEPEKGFAENPEAGAEEKAKSEADISEKEERARAESEAGKGGKLIEFDSLDNILRGKEATYIKFDVEGQERRALDGAAETIRRYKPKMLVSCYHRVDDIFALPLKVLSLRNDYKVYMRHYPYIPAWDTAFYFV